MNKVVTESESKSVTAHGIFNNNIMLNTEELIEVRKLKEEIIQTVNQNIMILSEKISKITNKRELCNGTCW